MVYLPYINLMVHALVSFLVWLSALGRFLNLLA